MKKLAMSLLIGLSSVSAFASNVSWTEYSGLTRSGATCFLYLDQAHNYVGVAGTTTFDAISIVADPSEVQKIALVSNEDVTLSANLEFSSVAITLHKDANGAITGFVAQQVERADASTFQQLTCNSLKN